MARDERGFVDTQSNQKDFKDALVSKDAGPYLGTVKDVADPLRMGRLGVNIPALSFNKDPAKSNIVWCQYLSPFYGVKSLNAVSKTDPYSYQTTQQAYGMWAIPPDIDTTVLVIFAKGERNDDKAFWIGCVQDPLTNAQVPAYGSSKNSAVGVDTVGDMDTAGKKGLYGTDFLPIGEKNRIILDGDNIDNANQWKLPVNVLLSDQLLQQGLIDDRVRGTISSSARRETPSNVFGWSTPGKIRPDARTVPIGIKGAKVKVDRETGHSLVMDDGDENGTNQLTRLRTASGHQLLMHDTEGVVYIANGSGKSWIEMSAEGKVYIYAQDGFNMRSDGNFDLHSGGDINFHAKHNIKFTAEVDLVNNANFIMNVGEYGIVNSSQSGGISSYAKSGLTSHGAVQLHSASGSHHLKGARIDFNTDGTQQPAWGPSWLTSEAAGIITDTSQNDVNITVGAGQILEANTKKTKTTVPNLVTHEPFTRAPSGVFENISQWQDPVKWKELSETPGTLEYMAQQNRISDVEYIRELQFFTDQSKYVQDKGGKINNLIKNNIKKNIDLSKAKKLSDTFTSQYNKIFNVKSVMKNLSKDNLNQILTNKVVAGKFTSVASSLKGMVLGRTSANNLPPSMRGSLAGQITQVGAAIRNNITSAIGKFKFW